MTAAPTTLNWLVLATRSRRELELDGYKREEVNCQSNKSSYNQLTHHARPFSPCHCQARAHHPRRGRAAVSNPQRHDGRRPGAVAPTHGSDLLSPPLSPGPKSTFGWAESKLELPVRAGSLSRELHSNTATRFILVLYGAVPMNREISGSIHKG